jgi:Ca2+-transporting ATPase
VNSQISSEDALQASPDAVLEKLSVDASQGLTHHHVQQRRDHYGWNRLAAAKQRGAREILIDQFKSPIIGLLSVAAVLAFIFQEWIEGIAVVMAIALNAVVGFTTELRAVKSMKSLQKLSKTQAKVKRNGQVREIAADRLVPGDIVVLEGGDVVPADLRLLKTVKLQIDESALTGESMPVSKSTEAVNSDAPLAEQRNRGFKGTAITRGSGEGVVTAIGMDTELGKISELAAQAGGELTPLEQRLDQLGRRLIWVTIAVAIVVAITGLARGKDLVLMVETAIALSVAAVPEGLPIVATVALARGMWRMSQKNALINRLSAVETLGSTSVICTDKTGTLTQNRMTVSQIMLTQGSVSVDPHSSTGFRDNHPIQIHDLPHNHPILHQLIRVGVLCNDAQASADEGSDATIGDPMEVALLDLGRHAGLKRSSLQQHYPRHHEVAFDPEVKMMATYHKNNDDLWVAVKGAPEMVLECCSHYAFDGNSQHPFDATERDRWQDKMRSLAESGLRILAFATKQVKSKDVPPYQDLTLLGLVGLEDPPRTDVADAIHACHVAGIRVIMVTGDQPITAQNIGLSVGVIKDKESQALTGQSLHSLDDITEPDRHFLRQSSIFARVSPEQKLNLIDLHQRDGAIVAMTGDGVNDAPALQKADIGVAMGQRGTQVAQEAADMVLQDDAFGSILSAVAQGRTIFRNIRQFTLYLLSGNMGEILAVAVASLSNLPLPLLPLQILYINAVNDIFPALALGFGEGNPQMMQRPPRKDNEAILTRWHWRAIALYGALIAITTLSSQAIALKVLNLSDTEVVTISFMTLAFARLWHIFNMRSHGTGVLDNEVIKNPYVWGSLVLCTFILLGAVYIPGLSDALGTTPLSWRSWSLVVSASLIPVIIGQVTKQIIAKPSKNPKV